MMTATLDDTTTLPALETRYCVGELIGQGAVGFVYAARDVVLGIDVAVKIMRHEHANTPSVVERFKREADIAARMLSPHVVKVLGVAKTRTGAPCIVYEFLKGETLAARIAREKTLTLADTADIVRQTSRALARAHALGVIHQDVKPDNIFLVEQEDGRPLVKLLDFGVAEMMSPGREVKQTLAGTPEYMAPEVLFGVQPADVRADLYALGVVAFECLTGACPFPGENVQEVLVRVGGGHRPALLDLRPDLHLEIDEWMERALAPDPFWRFSSAKELGDAIDNLVRLARPARPTLRRAA
jgi:serine/threonine-protein kinase